MSSEKATALVLRVVDFSESSSVVTLFTREFGKISGLAKGAKRPKGAFDSALDLLCTCRVVFLRKSSEALDLLTEAKLIRRFRLCDKNLSRLYAGYYVAELLLELTDEYDAHPELFDNAERTLLRLGSGPSVGTAIAQFEMAALQILGHHPSLEQCADCGSEIRPHGRIPFAQTAGGVLCPRCRPRHSQVVQVSTAVIEVLKQLANADNEALDTVKIERRAGGELRGVLNHYMTQLLGRPPRMQRYLVAPTSNHDDAGKDAANEP